MYVGIYRHRFNRRLQNPELLASLEFILWNYMKLTVNLSQYSIKYYIILAFYHVT